MFRSVAGVAVTLLLAGCTTAPAPPAGAVASTPVAATTTSSPAASSPAASSPASAATETPVPMPQATIQIVEISLTNGKATPNGDRLALAEGTTLELRITSDHDDEIHVHGYDVEIPVKAGAAVKRAIVLDQVGRFEVESHEPALTVLQLVVS